MEKKKENSRIFDRYLENTEEERHRWIPLIGINVVLVGASGSRHKDSQPQTKGLTNRQPRPQEERSRGPTPTILWHVFQYLVIMTFRRPFRPKSPRRIGN